MEVGYYPGWTTGALRDYFEEMGRDGQRRKAEAKLRLDILTLRDFWPKTLNVTVRVLKGYEPLCELKREYQGIAYRIFFCVKGNELWLLHSIEKESRKTPASDLNLAFRRMNDVLTGKTRRIG